MAEQEQRVNLLFRNIEDEFSALERLDDPSRAESKLRTITGMLRECKTCAHSLPSPVCTSGLSHAQIAGYVCQCIDLVDSVAGRAVSYTCVCLNQDCMFMSIKLRSSLVIRLQHHQRV